MLQDGIIEESFSLWSSPVLLVSKKADTKPCFVVDLRAVNRQTVPITFPLPTLDSIFDILSDSHPSFFSALDMKSGYWQIKLHSDSKDLTTFITHDGKFRF